ncbi:MAG: DNA polymerase I [Calditrichaeota bacterium]|nr:DNA polymerase I [Calditrichota bacterium]
MSEKRKRLFLIDGSALFYRSYFAFIRNPLFTSKGVNTSAIYGFTLSLMKILSEEKPDYIAVVFDTKEPTFRHKKFADYKATRQKMPEEMADQYPMIVELVKAFNIPVIELPGYEADDVIGTLAKKAEQQGIETYMVTGDKDFMQLLSPWIKMYKVRPGKDAEIVDLEKLRSEYGLTPEQVRDYLALMGDTSDNVPGVPRIGEKTALSLLREFHSLENLYEHLDRVPREAWRKALAENKTQAFLSRELVTIDTQVPVDISIEQLKAKPADARKLQKIFEELEFRSLMDRIPEFSGEPIEVVKTYDANRQNYHLIDSPEALDRFVQHLQQQPFFVFDTETTGLDIFNADVIGLAFSCKAHEAYYVPLSYPEGGLTPEQVWQRLKPIFEDANLKKGGQNIKFDGLMLWQHDIELKGIDFDTMIADYLINPGSRQHNLDNLSRIYLNYKMIPIEELIGKKGKKQKNMKDIAVDLVYPYACEDADITFQLKEILEKKLKETNTYDLFRQVEMPLVEVLMQMEKNGVSLDVPFLEEMSREIGTELQQLEQQIYQLAGEEFNINSPQQLGQILFEKLEIQKAFGNRRPSRTPTGQYSTSESVLEKYSQHPLVNKILEYRKLMKLKSTYVDALPRLISPRTGRLHTSFNQTVTATGRLSSSDPNLQNIPIRDEFGKKIRRAFIPQNPEDFILSADYSQIELRIMAHLSGDPGLREAFEKGEDIHATTAAAIFDIPIEEVTPDHRRKAKEVNFGIIYGISPYGLAARLGIDPDEAKMIITNYFVRFPKVNDYITHVIAFAHQHKYVTTILNRRRYIPEIDSKNANVRQNAERIAINTTIQGSAADLIKIAMIQIHRELQQRQLKTRMVLQVHDELVFEVMAEELETVRQLVKEKMETAIQLNVPLKVDIGVGKNWLEAH